MNTPGLDIQRYANVYMTSSSTSNTNVYMTSPSANNTANTLLFLDDDDLFTYNPSFQLQRNFHLRAFVVPGIHRKLKLTGWSWLGFGDVSAHCPNLVSVDSVLLRSRTMKIYPHTVWVGIRLCASLFCHLIYGF